ncbi:hypothetical protein ACUNV4_09995 [Granulosicoccus sp. 3-233]|uniref:hypothetical protein n=1 Tax=Granulosicoccus sp. 3-233 TaxID=3417969 RepID=UPI003D33C261
MKHYSSLVAAPLLLTLVACSSDSNHDFDGSKDELDAAIAADSSPQALFSPDPNAPVLPFPNSLFLLTSTDGTLDLPLGEGADETLANPRVALNQLDGFSTVAPIVTTISETLDPASLIVGDTIRVFEVSTAQAVGVTGVLSEISDPRLLAATSVGNQLILLPTVPLNPKSDYLVALTNGITDPDGNGLEANLTYGLLKSDQALGLPQSDLERLEELSQLDQPDQSQQAELAELLQRQQTLGQLELLRGATGSQLAAVQAATGIDASDIALTWVFRTQSTRDVLQAVKDQSTSSVLRLGNSGQTSPAGGKADIYIGSLEVPYYLTALQGDAGVADVLNSFWKNSDGNVVGTLNESQAPNYAPVLTSTETIPVLMSVPNATSASGGNMPADGWPVTIFQHGITGNRSFMLAIADAMADAGRAVIAIDMPLHGLIDDSNPLHAANSPFGVSERTFDIDLATNPLEDGTEVEDVGPDGEPDTSGKYFINLQNLANSRDNLRQSVADLFTLTASLSSAQVENVTLNAGNLNFVGHSLGGIVGTTMLSYDNSFQSATLAMPGGGIAQLLANSETFAPIINAGLQDAGIETGSDDYNTFLTAAQSLLDSGDPINHAATLAQSGATRLHMIEVLGDAVIPNSVATAPLAGTEPLARQLGLTQIVADSTNGGLVKFSVGDHASIIRAQASAAATVEMQRQTATFAASQGTQLPVTDDTVIAPLP